MIFKCMFIIGGLIEVLPGFFIFIYLLYFLHHGPWEEGLALHPFSSRHGKQEKKVQCDLP